MLATKQFWFLLTSIVIFDNFHINKNISVNYPFKIMHLKNCLKWLKLS